MASAEKPPKTTEWTAPMRAQASMAMTASANHGHVDEDGILGADAVGLEDIGEAADLALELAVGEDALLAQLALADEGGLVPAAVGHVDVDAVLADIELAADEPLGGRSLPSVSLGRRALSIPGSSSTSCARSARRPRGSRRWRAC